MFRHARRLLARDTRAIAAAGLAAAAVWSATAIPTPAHEGHDHGEAPRAAPMPGSPRVVATSERYQLVGIAEGEVLVLYLDRADDTGSTPASQLAEARILALRERGDEALTLAAHGSGSAYEQDFRDTHDRLSGALREPQFEVVGMVGDGRALVAIAAHLHDSLRPSPEP